MLRVRAEYRINEGEQADVPAVKARGLVVLVYRLPVGKGTQVMAINFGRTAVREAVTIKTARPGGLVKDILTEKALGTLGAGGLLQLALGPQRARPAHQVISSRFPRWLEEARAWMERTCASRHRT